MNRRIASLLGRVFLALAIGAAPLLAWAADAEKTPAPSFSLEVLRQRQQQVESLVEKVMACTVCVRSASGQGSGSGVIVSEDGLVLTAAHVTMAAGKDLIIIFPDGRRVKAKALGANRDRDAGMVQIDEEGKYPFVEIGKSADLESNQLCVALGHAGGFDPQRTPPIRLGRVLNNVRFVTTDCTLIGGDSGGPLFDLQGRVIGIHSNIGASLSQNNHVPIDAFLQDWDRIKGGETWGSLRGRGPRQNPNRPVLGVQMAQEPEDGGARIQSVLPESPAAKAGLQDGDLIRQVDGQDVKSPDEVIDLVSKKKPGQEVTLKVLRGEQELELKSNLVRVRDLTPSEKPEQKETPSADDETPEKTDDDNPEKERKEEATKEDDQQQKKQAPQKEKLDLQELLRRAQRNGGRLQLTPEQFREFQRQMAQRGRRPGAPSAAPTTDPWAQQLFQAFQPVIAPAEKSVFKVLVEDKPIALATAVRADGLLLTKASEIADRAFQVEISQDQKVPGELVKTYEDFDLAVVRVKGQTLTPAEFAGQDDLQLGAFIAAVGKSATPAAVGVVSVLPRSLKAERRGFLGVNLEKTEQGVKLTRVYPRSPAAEGGLKTGDVVQQLDGQEVKTPEEFAKAIVERKPDEKIRLQLIREEKALGIQLKLGDRSSLAQMPGRLGIMNQMGGELSRRRTDFKLAIQHDGPLRPQDCGGPLVDLDGKLLGINIARAGRIKSYAIPASAIEQLLRDEELKAAE